MPIKESTVSIARKTFKAMSVEQKKSLLRNLGHSTSFSKAKSMDELVKRGGGFAARDILRTVSLYKKRNLHLNRINFK